MITRSDQLDRCRVVLSRYAGTMLNAATIYKTRRKRSESKFPDDLQTINFSELGNISGGRALTQNEIKDADFITRRYATRKDKLKKEGQVHQVKELEDRFYDLFSKWLRDVGDAPDGSDDILFSSYPDPYL